MMTTAQLDTASAALPSPELPAEKDVVAPSTWRESLRLLPTETQKSRWKRRIHVALAIGVTVGFFVFLMAFFAPAPGNPGIDENAYLVGGRNVAERLSPGMQPPNPFAYVSSMWIRTPDGWYYPKYPAGVPLLDAIAIWVTGSNFAAFYVSPICASLAVLGVFFLTRAIAGSFLGLLASILLATNPTVLHLALVPSSHAPAIGFAVWGTVALLSWMRTGKLLTGIAAGFLLGYTCTTRYSEGLLLLPLGAAAISAIRWTKWRSYLAAAVPVLAWCIPVVTLVVFNRIATGQWTGYDSTHESTGFTWAEFTRKWEYTIHQIHMYGLFFTLPIGVLGMLLLFARSWRVALVMVLWFVPTVGLYMAYYWGLQTPGVSYLRFYLTLYPPVIACALWLVSEVSRSLAVSISPAGQALPRRGYWAAPVAVSLFVAAVGTAGIYVALPDMRDAYMQNANQAYSARAFLAAVPAAKNHSSKQGPVLFGDDGGMFSRALMYFQFIGNGEWYTATAFTNRRSGGMMGALNRFTPGGNPNDPNAQDNPVLIQPERVAYTKAFYAKQTDADFAREEARVINAAIESGRGAYAILQPSSVADFKTRVAEGNFECKELANWTEPLRPAADTNAGRGILGGLGGRGGRQPGGAGGRGGPFGGQDTVGLSPGRRAMRMGSAPASFVVLQIVPKAPKPLATAATTRPRP